MTHSATEILRREFPGLSEEGKGSTFTIVLPAAGGTTG